MEHIGKMLTVSQKSLTSLSETLLITINVEAAETNAKNNQQLYNYVPINRLIRGEIYHGTTETKYHIYYCLTHFISLIEFCYVWNIYFK